jgi:hypothetical protein
MKSASVLVGLPRAIWPRKEHSTSAGEVTGVADAIGPPPRLWQRFLQWIGWTLTPDEVEAEENPMGYYISGSER